MNKYVFMTEPGNNGFIISEGEIVHVNKHAHGNRMFIVKSLIMISPSSRLSKQEQYYIYDINCSSDQKDCVYDTLEELMQKHFNEILKQCLV